MLIAFLPQYPYQQNITLVLINRNQDTSKPTLLNQFQVGDSYVTVLTTLHFPSKTGYHRFDYPLYSPVEQSFIESIAFRLVTKTGQDVAFDNSSVPSLVILHFKKKSSAQ